jgi:hypothetical protein
VYSGARRDTNILCWDVRHTRECLYALSERLSDSNQRIAFDIEPCGRLLLTGGTDGRVRFYDLTDGSLKSEIEVAQDTVGGISIHPTLPLLLTASGHRRFVDVEKEGDAGESVEGSWSLGPGRNELAVWRLDSSAVATEEGEGEDVGRCVVENVQEGFDPGGGPDVVAEVECQNDMARARLHDICDVAENVEHGSNVGVRERTGVVAPVCARHAAASAEGSCSVAASLMTSGGVWKRGECATGRQGEHDGAAQPVEQEGADAQAGVEGAAGGALK